MQMLNRTVAVFGLMVLSICTLVSAARTTTVEGGKVYNFVIAGGGAFKFDSARYAMFLPDSLTQVKAIFVHQHGCGSTPGGRSDDGNGIPYDLQYRAFVKKWGLALLGPGLYSQGSCSNWCDPANGSDASFIGALDTLARVSGHQEIKTVPWLLWGHSGGGMWVLKMTVKYPDRILAVFAVSPAFNPLLSFTAVAAKIPIVLRRGAGEVSDGNNVEATVNQAFITLKGLGGCVSKALDPATGHNAGQSRYFAIPYFESALGKRLPANITDPMLTMDSTKFWVGDSTTHQIYSKANFTGSKAAACYFPDSNAAAKWKEYVTNGDVHDVTPPLVTTNLRATSVSSGVIDLTWNAEVDYEKGIQALYVYQGTTKIATLSDNSYMPGYQNKEYGDAPIPVIPLARQWRVSGIGNNTAITFYTTTLNWDNLESPKGSGLTITLVNGFLTATRIESVNRIKNSAHAIDKVSIYSLDGRMVAAWDNASSVPLIGLNVTPGVYIHKGTINRVCQTRKVSVTRNTRIGELIKN